MKLYREEFKNWMQIKSLSERSIEIYLFYLDKLELFSELNQDSINEFLVRYNQQIPRALIKNYREFINDNKVTLNINKEEIDRIRDIVIPRITGRQKKRIPKVINKLQVYALVEAMTSERNKLMTLITFYGGLRLGGLLSITPLNFNWSKWKTDNTKSCELKVIEKGDKERMVFIPSDVAQRLKSWIRNYASQKNPDPNKPLFDIAQRQWEKLIEKASIKALGFKISPHVLRHSSATYLLECGWDIKEIQEYLGHESIQSTEIYLHIDKSRLKEKFEAN